MTIEPETKYLIEDYVDIASRFQDILDFYKNCTPEAKKYFDERFESITKQKFTDIFGALLTSKSAKEIGKKARRKRE